MRWTVIVLCLALVGCRGKRVVTEMADTTRVVVDSSVVSTVRLTGYGSTESCEDWGGIEFVDSGGYVVVKDGRLLAHGVKRLRYGGSAVRESSAVLVVKDDSVAVRRTENRGVSVRRTGDKGAAAGWRMNFVIVACLAFGACAFWLRK